MYIASSNHTVGQVFNVTPDTIRLYGFLIPNTVFFTMSNTLDDKNNRFTSKILRAQIFIRILVLQSGFLLL